MTKRPFFVSLEATENLLLGLCTYHYQTQHVTPEHMLSHDHHIHHRLAAAVLQTRRA